MIHSGYQQQIDSYQSSSNKLARNIARIGWLRLVVLALSIASLSIGWNENKHLIWTSSSLVLFGIFLWLVRTHFRLKRTLQIHKTYLAVNQREFDFLTKGSSRFFYNGEKFAQDYHAYSLDLDILGEGSLFQHLNRTMLVKGQRSLADLLLCHSEEQDILRRQEAVQELSQLVEWRQAFQVFSELGKDSEEAVKLIEKWENETHKIPALSNLLSFLLPLIGALSMCLLIVTQDPKWFSLGIVVFIINLVVFGSVAKLILSELGKMDRLHDTFHSYSKLLSLIEQQEWTSELLREKKNRITNNEIPASVLLHKLGGIFRSLESVRNGFVMLNFNGTLVYHLHVYRKLLRWRKAHAPHINQWMSTIGEMESLVSLANFRYNNPSFSFPSINQEYRIEFEHLGHPLIPEIKRKNNTVNFSQTPFMILTGSNMSGKSTFLRTVGTALVLAKAGSVVAASKATIHPLHILVSMRLSDSLTDSESYFFAEVKRLQFIVQQLETQRAFVLLDEILRGTNSDDKRSGTIAVVEKMVQQKAIGIIATHDLEVCETTQKHPYYLSNHCFEVEIKDDELHFDYQLRNGICKNKSATFIMKKLHVI